MNSAITKKQLRQFGFLIGIVFPSLIGWIVPIILGHDFRFWTLWISFPAILLAIIYPKSLFYPYRAWISLGNVLGFINSHIILGLVFLLVLQPIALIMKVLGHDPLRKRKGSNKTYREIRNNKQIDLTRIF